MHPPLRFRIEVGNIKTPWGASKCMGIHVDLFSCVEQLQILFKKVCEKGRLISFLVATWNFSNLRQKPLSPVNTAFVISSNVRPHKNVWSK